MLDGCRGHDGDERDSGVSVAMPGMVARRPRAIKTAERYEVASFILGRGDLGGPEGEEVLVVCSGAGASSAVSGVAVGEEVIVVGRLVPRSAARPEDDAFELVADAVLARRGAGAVTTAAEPRIAP
ncbi:hypothetical protein [Clavibacter nebraskensis]|uniref:Uncharacterized protein n=1 Tax=Clavibacter nebraskensis NCPPB 2581 TaxID=1097677 RepID=A0AAI8ZI16_9MICO|nr:hypothetical protein [Clavibacter nebraskensis]KXU20616.1 hypothetical protein VV38_06725 [Clavibacter nebraskensis]OAH22166.1 hypothetical protein A3Q38_01845 [Clavibacter nebraskensis]CCE75374.1 hypothetical protein CMN_01424 [Clavibacter nebraskensis NCPPB 2581]